MHVPLCERCRYAGLSKEWVTASRIRIDSYYPQTVINGFIFMHVDGWRGGSSVSTDLNVYGKSDYSMNFYNMLNNLMSFGMRGSM